MRKLNFFGCISLAIICLNSPYSSAQTNGPTPIQAFDNSSVTDWVDSGGDFNYNIPLIELPGAPNGPYTFSLGYNSASVSLYGEASEVGLGWNLIGPGKIVRNLRGIPDDHNGKVVKEEREIKTNHNITLNIGAGAELFGFAVGNASLTLNQGFQFNNFSGFSTSTDLGLNLGFKNGLSAGLNISESTYGSSVSPSIGFNFQKEKSSFMGGVGLSGNFNSRDGLNSLQWSASAAGNYNIGDLSFNPNKAVGGPVVSFAQRIYYPSSKLNLYGLSFSGTFKAGAAVSGAFPNGFIRGSYGFQKLLEKEVETKGYGYLFLHNAEDDSLMDFYREKEGPIYPNTTNIGMSYATPDIFSVSGSGLSGSFRAYRTDLTILHDKKIESKSENYTLAAELGGGLITHIGSNTANSVTKASEGLWEDKNGLNKFLSEANDSSKPFYFKMLGEQALNDGEVRNFVEELIENNSIQELSDEMGNIDFNGSHIRLLEELTQHVEVEDEFKELGGGTAIRLQTSNIDKQNPFGNAYNIFVDKKGNALQAVKKLNDNIPRTVHIEYYSYDEIIDDTKTNSDDVLNLVKTTSYQKLLKEREDYNGEEIGAFVLTDTNGHRYVFGISTLNYDEEEHAKAVPKSLQCGDVAINGDTDYSNGFKNIKRPPSYSGSFLLTAILGHNYIDMDHIKGPSIGDFGDYITFQYELLDGKYRWRTPYKKATGTLVKGNLNDPRLTDDKAHYSNGKKEVWHLTSCETKTHRAEFNYSKRKDAKGAESEDGFEGTSFKLEDIELKTSETDNLIKKVILGYDYSLTQKVPNHDSSFIDRYAEDVVIAGEPMHENEELKGNGKLSLRYLGIQHFNLLRKDEFEFNYSDVNPDWKIGATNPWGGYRDYQDDYCKLLDFPYIDQKDRELADRLSSAWLLDEIITPSNGKINIDYESDDHSHTQNKSSMAMFKIESYNHENHLITIELLEPIPDDNDGNLENELKEFEKYVKNLDGQLYVKFYVTLKNDSDGLYDWVSGYVNIAKKSNGQLDLNLIESNNGEFTKATIRLEEIDNYDPIRLFAFQKLREQPELISDTPLGVLLDGDLSTQDIGAAVVFQQVILAAEVVANLGNGILELFAGFNGEAQLKGWGKPKIFTDSLSSFVRLNLPNGKKIGGGSRVKKITISDNWNELTLGAESDMITGFVYDYDLSDGTSSGVATNEPGIIGDENALRRANPFASTDKRRSQLHLFFEEPILESLFPAPAVTYSKINVTDLRSQQILDGTLNSPKYSNLGRIEKEYYTSKDYPTRVNQTELFKDEVRKYAFKFGFGDERLNTLIASQGYSITLNGMNGLEKGTSFYRLAANGNEFEEEAYRSQKFLYKSNTKYLSNGRKEFDLRNDVLVSAPYKKKPDSIPAILNHDVKFDYRLLGREPMDLSIEMKHQKIETKHLGIQGNVDVILIPAIIPIPIPIPLVLPSWKNEVNDSRTASTTKITRLNPILEKVIEFDKTKGIKRTTRNVLFDEFGNVVLSKSNNIFGDSIFTYQTPAHWRYDAMRPSYENSDNKNILSIYTGGLRSLIDPFPLDTKNTYKEVTVYGQEFCPLYGVFDNLNYSYPDRALRDIYHKINMIAQLVENKIPQRENVRLKIKPAVEESKIWSKFRSRKRKVVLKQKGLFKGLFGSKKKVLFYDELGNRIDINKLRVEPKSRLEYVSKFPEKWNSDLNHFRIVNENKKIPSIRISTNLNIRSKDLGLYQAVQLCSMRVKIPLVYRDSILDVQHRTFTNLPSFDSNTISYKHYNDQTKADLVSNYYEHNGSWAWKPFQQLEYIGEREQSKFFNPRKDGLLNNVLYFDWLDVTDLEFDPSEVTNNWIIKSETSKRDPNGTALEEIDANGKYITQLLGYNNSLQIASVTGDVKYHEIGYEGFEEYPSNKPIGKSDLSTGNIDFFTESDVERVELIIPARFGANYLGNGIFVGSNKIATQRFSEFINDLSENYIDHEIKAMNLFSGAGNLNISLNDILAVGMTDNGYPLIQVEENILPDFCPQVLDLGEICLPEIDLGFELIDYREPPLGSLDVFFPVDNTGISSKESHTGRLSLKVSKPIQFPQSRISLRKDRWYTLSGWYKVENEFSVSGLSSPEFQIEINGELVENSETTLKRGPEVEGWVKLDLEFKSIENTEDLAIRIIPASQNEETFITYFDDLRVHPSDALMTSKVYDGSRRLIAELDENNFASFFGYNGKDLINVNKETEKGIITINEYRYNTSKK